MYYVFCIFECLRAPRKMGKCSLGLPSLNKDFIFIIIIIITIIINIIRAIIIWVVNKNNTKYNAIF